MARVFSERVGVVGLALTITVSVILGGWLDSYPVLPGAGDQFLKGLLRHTHAIILQSGVGGNAWLVGAVQRLAIVFCITTMALMLQRASGDARLPVGESVVERESEKLRTQAVGAQQDDLSAVIEERDKLRSSVDELHGKVAGLEHEKDDLQSKLDEQLSKNKERRETMDEVLKLARSLRAAQTDTLAGWEGKYIAAVMAACFLTSHALANLALAAGREDEDLRALMLCNLESLTEELRRSGIRKFEPVAKILEPLLADGTVRARAEKIEDAKGIPDSRAVFVRSLDLLRDAKRLQLGSFYFAIEDGMRCGAG